MEKIPLSASAKKAFSKKIIITCKADVSQQSTATSTRSHINQNCGGKKGEKRSVISAAHLVFHSSLHHPHPPASLRPAPSVSDSSLVCCQSSYMSEQAAIHSSPTLLCTQGIPSPVSAPRLALSFCLSPSRSSGSVCALPCSRSSVCAKVQRAVTYFAPCGAFLSFHVLLLCTAARMSLMFVEEGASHARRRSKNRSVTTGTPRVHEPTPKDRGYYCVPGLIRLVLTLPSTGLPSMSQVHPYSRPRDPHLFSLAVVNILYYLNSRSRHGLFVPGSQPNHNSARRMGSLPNVCDSENANPVL